MFVCSAESLGLVWRYEQWRRLKTTLLNRTHSQKKPKKKSPGWRSGGKQEEPRAGEGKVCQVHLSGALAQNKYYEHL